MGGRHQQDDRHSLRAEIPYCIEQAIEEMEARSLEEQMKEQEREDTISPYWVMNNLLGKVMMEREQMQAGILRIIGMLRYDLDSPHRKLDNP
jgi:hypothetical protein